VNFENKEKRMFLVVGITGRTGGAVARHLLSRGKQIRALVREPAKAADWASAGVELIVGDLGDPGAITAALRNVEGAFFMLPPNYTPSRDFKEAKVLIAAYAEALRSANLPRLVVLSANGAEKTSGLGAITPLSLLELALEDLPYPHAFLRAGALYENFLYALQADHSGTLDLFYAKTKEKHPMTAIEDIGAETARLLTGPIWLGKRVIELGTMVSPDELMMDLSAVLERDVKAQVLPRQVWTSTIERMGFLSGQTWAFEEIYDGVNSHWIGFGVDGAERLPGSTSAREVFAAAKSASQT
jgi:uncharacterized protein YbjT (DUF2867 family)